MYRKRDKKFRMIKNRFSALLLFSAFQRLHLIWAASLFSLCVSLFPRVLWYFVRRKCEPFRFYLAESASCEYLRRRRLPASLWRCFLSARCPCTCTRRCDNGSAAKSNFYTLYGQTSRNSTRRYRCKKQSLWFCRVISN